MKLPAIDPRRLLQPGANVVAGWQAFWFTPADPTVLGLIRIFTGLVLVWILLASGRFLPWLYAADGWVDLKTTNLLRRETPWVPPTGGWNEDALPEMIRPELSAGQAAEAYRQRWGVDPGQTVDIGVTIFSQWFHITDPRWMQIVHWLAVVVAVLFTLGVGTRVVSVLAWALALGYIHRTRESLFGMDTMLAILLLYLMIAPAGAALSLDRLLQRFRQSYTALSHRKPLPLLTPAPSVSANVALRLLQVHFCIIYLASGCAKLQGAAWWNGTAVWQTFSNYEFTPERFVYFTPLLRWLTNHRILWEIVNSGGSVFTLGLELGLPFLIWFPRCALADGVRRGVLAHRHRPDDEPDSVQLADARHRRVVHSRRDSQGGCRPALPRTQSPVAAVQLPAGGRRAAGQRSQRIRRLGTGDTGGCGDQPAERGRTGVAVGAGAPVEPAIDQ